MEKQIVKDNVNHPSHYTNGSIECIDAMLSAFGKEKVQHFCKLNAFKYVWRADNKNHAEKYIVEGAKHAESYETNPQEYERVVMDFINRHIK